MTQPDLKIVENRVLDRRRLDFEGSWPRFWRVWASILEPPDSILECLGTPQNRFSERKTFFLFPFLCAATWARSGTLPTATWISLSGAKFDPEADFDVRFAVARQNPRQIGKKQNFSSEIFAEKIFFASKNETSEIVCNVFWQSFAPIRAKFDGKTAVGFDTDVRTRR